MTTKKSRKVVMFDVDGVLADFYTAYRNVQTLLGQNPCDSTRWDDYWDEAVWHHIRNSPDFFRRAPALVDADTFRRINDLTYAADVYFVTARLGDTAKSQTDTWLRMKGITSPTVIRSGRKAEVARALEADYSIEDNVGNAVAVAYLVPRCQSFLLDTKFNRFEHDVLGVKVRRIYSVEEYLDEVAK